MNYVYKNLIGKDVSFSYGSPLENADLVTICCPMEQNWITLLDIDFVKNKIEIPNDSNQIVIDNHIFDIINREFSNHIKIAGNGLEIKVNERESEWFSARKTMPGISFDISQLFQNQYKGVGNIDNFDMRIIAQVYGKDETETFEQTNCGIEIKSLLPENNQISYFLRSSDGQGHLFHGTQVTHKNISEDFADDYLDNNLSVIIFEITNKKSVSVLNFTPEKFDQKFSFEDLYYSNFVSDVFWSPESNNDVLGEFSDLNFCFGPTTSNKNRKNTSYLLRLCIQIRSK